MKEEGLIKGFTNYGEQGLSDRGFLLLQTTASIQDEKRLTTDMGGDFLEKEGFYNTLLGRGCLWQSKCGY